VLQLLALEDGKHDSATEDYGTFKVIVTKIHARNPDAAIDQAKERAPALEDADKLVAVPESSWHVFERATTFRRVG
jgi:hypothetical protein